MTKPKLSVEHTIKTQVQYMYVYIHKKTIINKKLNSTSKCSQL